MTKEILCTLGPASMNPRIIGRLEELGATLFRVNLSHTSLNDVARIIDDIQHLTSVPICIDTEGAQIRTGDLVEGSVLVRDNAVLRAHVTRVPGDSRDINLYPPDIVLKFRPGDFVSIDFNAVLAQVVDVAADSVEMRVLNGGRLGQNKAVTVERPIALPPLTEKDRAALEIGRRMGIRHFALSFANRSADVDEIRDIVGKDAFVISKIECRDGVANLDEIMAKSDAVLIDRGDLAREVPIERLPNLQKTIIRRAKDAGVPVYVATNLLESMVSAPEPTRAEVNDIYNTLADGADGLVLAAETAVGENPVLCAGVVVRMIHEFERGAETDTQAADDDPLSLLVPPHGGRLVRRTASAADYLDIERLPALTIADTELMDCEQIAAGTFSPITGFMDRQTLESVLDHNCLPDGTVWTMPIILQVTQAQAARIGCGERIALTRLGGKTHAVLDVTEVFGLDIDDVARRWFGTESRDHPGVARLAGGGEFCVAGEVTSVCELPSPYRHYQLTPSQTRFLFAYKGWSRVVGFHTRNAVHRAHEYIQREALERTGADGLYISPVIGAKKPHDFQPDAVLRSYKLMLDFGLYPAGRVVLGGFATHSRYCGPREAVFTALCRKNMGCSHFIIGRDHTGVGNFYAPDANRRMFESLGDLGIAPVFFDTVGYNPKSERFEESNGQNALEQISGTRVRECLLAGEPLPDWFMRDIVQEMLRGDLHAGRPVFLGPTGGAAESLPAAPEARRAGSGR